MVKIVKHYSPYLNQNFLTIRVLRWRWDLSFKTNKFIGPYEDLVEKYK